MTGEGADEDQIEVTSEDEADREEPGDLVRAVAELAAVELPPRPPPVPRIGAAGNFIGNAMVGMYQAIYGHKDEVVMVADANGDPDPDAELDLPPDPRQAKITFHRPPEDP